MSLEDLYNGAERSARISRNVICPKCRGTGAKDGEVRRGKGWNERGRGRGWEEELSAHCCLSRVSSSHPHPSFSSPLLSLPPSYCLQTMKCKACNGRGARMVQQQMAPGFVVQMQETCQECGGRGTIYKTACPHCGGRKVVVEEKQLTAQIEKGMPSNAEIRFEKESEQQPGITPGDVIFKLKQVEHPRYKREGDNLRTEVHLTLKEALLGFRKGIRQLDGRELVLTYSGVTQPFETRKITGEGMPVHNYPSQHGDLFVKYIVDLPRQLSENQKEAARALFE